jgi:saccharopine dehydrogenase-like NADP-dependent oxidoreductase
MPRALIIGGYGVFGARAAERLARGRDVEIVVAGRNAARAAATAAELAARSGACVTSAVVDAARIGAGGLAEIGADVVVNASGPFQEQDYTVARAAIAARTHYVDLADAHAFVAGIGALDAEARAAGVLVVSGASSVPGLSGAVLDHYAPRFARLRSMTYGISPGNSFDPGAATVASLLGGAGAPFPMRIDGRMQQVHGWQGLMRTRFPGLGPRLFGHCDVPDLTLLPARHPSLETVRFVAGVEVALFHLGMWAISWLRRLGLIRRPERLGPALLAVKGRLGFLGSDKGGMFVHLQGQGTDGGPMRIAWHLEAGSGHGPYIPAIAAVMLARRLARGEMATRGAMPCLGLVSLEDFMAEVADLDIRATDTATPLYLRVLGEPVRGLPARVAELHDVRTETRWRGRADVERGTGLVPRVAGLIAQLPPTSRDVPLTVTFTPEDGDEIWTRDFGGDVFRSRQGEQGRCVWERVGPVRFVFRPTTDADGLRLVLEEVRALGVRLPRPLWPRIATREWQEGGRYRFSVEAALPVVGNLVRYTGWLDRDGTN